MTKFTEADYTALIADLAMLEELILGTTEAIEAEYGYNTDMPFSVVHMYDGDFLQIEGFLTRAEAKAAYEWGHNSGTIAYTSIA